MQHVLWPAVVRQVDRLQTGVLGRQDLGGLAQPFGVGAVAAAGHHRVLVQPDEVAAVRPATGTPAAESAAPSRSGSVIRIGLAIWNSMAPLPVTSPGSRTYVASTRPSTGAAISTWQPRSVSS